MGARYATGRHAVGECARSGRKMLRRHMVEDGYRKGLLVDPQWYDPPHPQERIASVTDAVALSKPAPEQSSPAGEGDAAPSLESFLPPVNQ